MDVPRHHHLQFKLSSRRSSGGFTLTELLVVVAIVVSLASFAMPAMNTVLKGSQLTQGAQMVGDQLSLARQAALSSNRCVEVRFYQYGDPQIPGEQPSNPSAGKYRALQLFQVQETGATLPMGKMQVLPSSIIFDSGATLSTLFGSTLVRNAASWTASDPKISLPRIGTNYNCCAFRFLPDGSTNLSPATGSSWFTTLHAINDQDSLPSPPANFFTIQVDPTNGHIKTFRP